MTDVRREGRTVANGVAFAIIIDLPTPIRHSDNRCAIEYDILLPKVLDNCDTARHIRNVMIYSLRDQRTICTALQLRFHELTACRQDDHFWQECLLLRNFDGTASLTQGLSRIY